MKYFTSDWWENGCENIDHVFEKYRNHLKSIKPNLPSQLIELDEHYTLHDSEVKKVLCSFNDKSLAIELLGWNIHLQFPVKYKLIFSGVEYFKQKFPQQEYVESELGDIVFWELDLVQGKIEMNLLFVSRAEFIIRFDNFEFSHENTNT